MIETDVETFEDESYYVIDESDMRQFIGILPKLDDDCSYDWSDTIIPITTDAVIKMPIAEEDEEEDYGQIIV